MLQSQSSWVNLDPTIIDKIKNRLNLGASKNKPGSIFINANLNFVIDINDLIRTSVVYTYPTADPGAPAATILAPQNGHRYRVRAISVECSKAASLQDIFVTINSSVSILHQSAAASTMYTGLLPQDIVLDFPNGTISTYNVAYIAGDTISAQFLLTDELIN